MARRPIRRARGGTYDIRLPPEVRALLKSLAGQLLVLLEDPAADPGLVRLSPVAYPDDPEREAEYRAMVGDELLEGRRRTARILEATADATTLEEEELEAWMRAVNDVRLVLGTKLDVSEDDDLDALALDDQDPEAAAYALYHYLGHLLEQIVVELRL